MYRILSVEPDGIKGNKVKVNYYDTETHELHVKKDTWDHITPSREIVPEKHGYTWERLYEELKAKYPEEHFEMQTYHRAPAVESAIQYRHGQNSFIVWHRGNRETMHDLEFYIDEKSTKQIFIRNPTTRFRARTILGTQENIESIVSDALKHKPSSERASVKSKQQAGKVYAELKCTQKQLDKLNPYQFRIIEYGSDLYRNEQEARQHHSAIQTNPAAMGIIDRMIIKEFRDEKEVKRYQAIATASLQRETQALLMKYRFKPQKDEYGKLKRATSQELWDPLNLNSPTEQLRWFFPAHMPFNPGLSLESQACLRFDPFKESDLEQTVNEAYDFYMDNSAIVDIETTKYTKGQRNTGRISMIIVNELKNGGTSTLYVTKEFMKTIEYNQLAQQQFNDTRIIFAEDEAEAIAKASDQLERYTHVFGHNIDDFDYFHLSKFNKIESHSRKSAKTGRPELFVGKEDGFQYDSFTAQEIAGKVRVLRKQKTGNQKLLFGVKRKDVLDTYTYLQRRVSLLGNHKLESFAGFTKSIDYEQLEALTQSEVYEDKEIALKYVIEDGLKTRELVSKILYNAVVESFASSANLRAVFSAIPKKNFHDSGARRYFMKLHTYRDRHETNVKDNIMKLRDRDAPDDIMYMFMTTKGQDRQTYGELYSKLWYPSILFDSFREIIDNNTMLRFMYQKMEEEKDPVLKEDWISKMEFALTVPIDKVKNFMHERGLMFGVEYSPEHVFPVLSQTTLEGFDQEFRRPFEGKNVDFFNEESGFSQFDMSESSFIYWNEYSVANSIESRFFEDKLSGSVTYREVDTTMLRLNNELAQHLKEFRQNPVLGRSSKFVVSNEEKGIPMGQLIALNMEDDRIFGELFSEKGKIRFYQGFRKPKEGMAAKIIEEWYNGSIENPRPLIEEVSRLPLNVRKSDLVQQLSIHALGYNPLTTKSQPPQDIQGKLFK